MARKHLHFAGYEFTSGPDGTTIHRPTPSAFAPGDRVRYRDFSLGVLGDYQGVVETADGKWATVRWNRNGIVSREWAPNLVAESE